MSPTVTEPAKPTEQPAPETKHTKQWFQVFHPEDDPEATEVLRAFAFSPPFLVAWSLGYLSDFYFFFVMAMMAMPLLKDKMVEKLGGRGAWAPKPVEASAAPAKGKKAKPGPPPKPTRYQALLDAMFVPTGVWLPPFLLISMSSPERDATFFMWVAGIYAMLVLVQYFIDPLKNQKKKAEALKKKA